MTFADTTVLFACAGKSTTFTAFVHGVADPVESRITANGLMGWVNKDDFIVLVDAILVDPVGVQDPKVATSPGDSFLSGRAEGTLEFEMVDSLTDWFTKGGTFLDGFLSVTTTDSNSVDYKALLGLVAQTSGFDRSRWP